MNFWLLYKDELRGFVRSRVMMVLWIGLPIIVVLIRLMRPDADEVPMFLLSAILISTIGGTLSAVMLSTAITNEKQRHVYDLFLIRPVRRSTLLVSKYLAALTSLVAAAFISLAIGIVTDLAAGYPTGSLIEAGAEPLLLSFAGMAIACAVGVLLGVLLDSVVASAIISVYLGNQLSALAVLPSLLAPQINATLIALAAGIVLPAVLLVVAVQLFVRKTV